MLTTTTYNFLATSLEDVVSNENIKPLILKGSPIYGDITVRKLIGYLIRTLIQTLLRGW